MRRRYPFGLYVALLALLAGLLAAAGCSRGAPPAGAGDLLQATVSVLPQKYLVERVGGGHVAVNVLVGPGAEPHTYEPVASQLRALSRSAVYFTVGVEFEAAWMDRFRSANRQMEIVDTTAGIDLLPMVDHGHDGGAAHAGEERDPHVWTSPRRAAQMARTICEALVRLDAAHADDYRANLAALEEDITALDADIRTTLAGAQGAQFLVFHPAWGYFAADYGLHQVPIEVGGQEPSAAELAATIKTARAEGIRVVFAQPNLSTRSAETIAAELGGRVVLVDPLAEDWLSNLRKVAEALAAAVAG